jgi:hypothetical protein
MADQDQQGQERTARQAAINAAVYNGVGLILQLGIIIAIARRDWLRQQALRYRWYVLRQWRGERERRLVADLQRDVSRMQHEGMTGDD